MLLERHLDVAREQLVEYLQRNVPGKGKSNEHVVSCGTLIETSDQ